MTWLVFLIGLWAGINFTVFALGVWVAAKEKPGDRLPWFEDWNSPEDSIYDD